MIRNRNVMYNAQSNDSSLDTVLINKHFDCNILVHILTSESFKKKRKLSFLN